MRNDKERSLEKRPKSGFSLAEKQKLYSEWKVSGLSKSKFCEEKELVLSIFSGWCRGFSGDKSDLDFNRNWMPPNLGNTTKESKNPMLVEVKLPNGMTFSTSFKLTCFLSLLKKLSDALNDHKAPTK